MPQMWNIQLNARGCWLKMVLSALQEKLHGVGDSQKNLLELKYFKRFLNLPLAFKPGNVPLNLTLVPEKRGLSRSSELDSCAAKRT